MWLERRTRLVIYAVFLAAVPTAWTVFFQELGDVTLWVRVPVGVAWLTVALFTARLAIDRDERLDRIAADRAEELANRVTRVTEDLLGVLLSKGSLGVPREYDFTLYAFEPEEQLLRPLWPEDSTTFDVKSFEPGKGATGRAWQEHETKLVTRADVSNDAYELTPEQQAFFAAGRAVVATPVDAPDGTPIGVLTAYSTTDDNHFEESSNRERFRDLAAAIGALVDAVSRSAGG